MDLAVAGRVPRTVVTNSVGTVFTEPPRGSCTRTVVHEPRFVRDFDEPVPPTLDGSCRRGSCTPYRRHEQRRYRVHRTAPRIVYAHRRPRTAIRSRLRRTRYQPTLNGSCRRGSCTPVPSSRTASVPVFTEPPRGSCTRTVVHEPRFVRDFDEPVPPTLNGSCRRGSRTPYRRHEQRRYRVHRTAPRIVYAHRRPRTAIRSRLRRTSTADVEWILPSRVVYPVPSSRTAVGTAFTEPPRGSCTRTVVHEPRFVRDFDEPVPPTLNGSCRRGSCTPYRRHEQRRYRVHRTAPRIVYAHRRPRTAIRSRLRRTSTADVEWILPSRVHEQRRYRVHRTAPRTCTRTVVHEPRFVRDFDEPVPPTLNGSCRRGSCTPYRRHEQRRYRGSPNRPADRNRGG